MPEKLPYHLRENAAPLAQCTDCQRKSWSDDDVGEDCNMPQPSGSACRGVMVATAAWWRNEHDA